MTAYCDFVHAYWYVMLLGALPFWLMMMTTRKRRRIFVCTLAMTLTFFAITAGQIGWAFANMSFGGQMIGALWFLVSTVSAIITCNNYRLWRSVSRRRRELQRNFGRETKG